MAMKENTKMILNYLKEVNGQDVTSADVAEALGLDKRQVDGSFTSFQKKGYGVRIPAEKAVTDENGNVTHKQIKLLELTEKGMAVDPDSEDA